MKFAAVLIIVAFAVAHSVAEKQFAQKLCRTEEDCDWDQCCIDAQTRIPGFHGICDNPTRRGAVCNPDPNDRTEEGRYRKACPCKEGLSCKPQQEEIGGRIQSIYVCQA
ncbi:hypothetical protein HNY73_003147 [Argiope bruennichi]|uniref:Uncharacterized protein n=1 Tax=Argiope bruennichi TaxID=94029 RepID=A0A8T0FX46_ARGBR|nr:hypothetical protein HNY73_003147 [Argiope bruennichi]